MSNLFCTGWTICSLSFTVVRWGFSNIGLIWPLSSLLPQSISCPHQGRDGYLTSGSEWMNYCYEGNKMRRGTVHKRALPLCWPLIKEPSCWEQADLPKHLLSERTVFHCRGGGCGEGRLFKARWSPVFLLHFSQAQMFPWYCSYSFCGAHRSSCFFSPCNGPTGVIVYLGQHGRRTKHSLKVSPDITLLALKGCCLLAIRSQSLFISWEFLIVSTLVFQSVLFHLLLRRPGKGQKCTVQF